MSRRQLKDLESRHPLAISVLRTALHHQRLHHAYLLTGRHAPPLLDIAHHVASALVCQAHNGHVAPDESCGACPGCIKFDNHTHPDVLHLPSPPSVGAVREIMQRLALKPFEASMQVVFINDAAQLNPQAQNALLKTLEEPPGPTCFLLTTTRLKAVLPTVRSRCQILHILPTQDDVAEKVLVQAGVAEDVAKIIVALVGDDTKEAERLLGLGVTEIIAQLDSATSTTATPSQQSRIAQDLGSDNARADLALALLEVQVRDRLAQAYHAAPNTLYTLPSPVQVQRGTLSKTAEQLSLLRRYTAVHLNRTLALENVFMRMTERAA